MTASYRTLFKIREFRYLYVALVLSYVGDQLAAVAVSVLVYEHTKSGMLTAIAYASSWLPSIVGGPVLGPLADRFRRREVLIVCDVVRAVLVAALVIPGLPLAVAIALLYIANLLKSPFTAGRSALMPEILTGDTYIAGNGLMNITHQLTVISGFAIGGLAVTLVQPQGALLLNAASFALSALLLRIGVQPRPAPARHDPAESPSPVGRRLLGDMTAGIRHVFGDRWLWTCLLLVWLALALADAHEALAVPYAEELGGGPRTAGVMLAMPAVGYVAGAVLLTRILRPAVRDRLIAPCAVFCMLGLVPLLLEPPLPVVLAILFIAGFGGAFSAPLNALFAQRIANEYRGRVMGVAISGIQATHGLAFLIVGALVDAGLQPSTVVGLCGAVGAAPVAILATAWARSHVSLRQRRAHTP
ncbi:MFS transporter [Actinopolymorpha alba]|uniref:MFS transporter n=1 Tax=Actinopolymorpha alba TaxID=533267 RepID=UPI000370A143|nr:MFS transporter [Actinopolymorpha alba]